MLDQARATLFYAVGQTAVAIAGAVMTKVLATRLGPPGVGVSAQLNRLLLLMTTIAQLGVGNAIAVLSAERAARSDWPALQALVSTSIAVVGGCAALVSLAGSLFSGRIALTSLSDPSLGHLIAIVSLAVPFSALGQVLCGVLQGLLEVGRLTLARVAVAAATVAASTLICSWGILGFAVGRFLMAVVEVVVLVCLLMVASGPRPKITVASPRLEGATALHLLCFGVVLLGTQAWVTLESVVVNSIVIGRLGVDQAGLYQAAFGIPYQLLTTLLLANSMYALPKISRTRRDLAAVVQIKNEALRVLLLFWLPAACCVTILGKAVVITFYRPDFMPAASLYGLQLLGDLGLLISRPLRVGLLPMRRFRAHLGLLALQGAIRISLLYICIDHLGLYAAIITYAIATWAMVGASYVYIRRAIGFAFSQKSRALLAKSLLVFVITAILVHNRHPVLAYGLPSALLIAWCLTALSPQETAALRALGREQRNVWRNKLWRNYEL